MSTNTTYLDAHHVLAMFDEVALKVPYPTEFIRTLGHGAQIFVLIVDSRMFVDEVFRCMILPNV